MTKRELRCGHRIKKPYFGVAKLAHLAAYIEHCRTRIRAEANHQMIWRIDDEMRNPSCNTSATRLAAPKLEYAFYDNSRFLHHEYGRVSDSVT